VPFELGDSGLNLHSFTVEPKSSQSSLNSSAVIMPEAAPSTSSPSTGTSFETSREKSPAASVDDDDADSVISMSTEGSFIDVEGVTTTTGTVVSEDQQERDEFDFV